MNISKKESYAVLDGLKNIKIAYNANQRYDIVDIDISKHELEPVIKVLEIFKNCIEQKKYEKMEIIELKARIINNGLTLPLKVTKRNLIILLTDGETIHSDLKEFFQKRCMNVYSEKDMKNAIIEIGKRFVEIKDFKSKEEFYETKLTVGALASWYQENINPIGLYLNDNEESYWFDGLKSELQDDYKNIIKLLDKAIKKYVNYILYGAKD